MNLSYMIFFEHSKNQFVLLGGQGVETVALTVDNALLGGYASIRTCLFMFTSPLSIIHRITHHTQRMSYKGFLMYSIKMMIFEFISYVDMQIDFLVGVHFFRNSSNNSCG